MAPEDLRTFLSAIDRSGDLINIDDEVDWDQELAGIATTRISVSSEWVGRTRAL